MQKICLLNLGCRVNQYEIDALLNSFNGRFETISTLDYADIYIVNTCAVTQEAEKKSRQILAKIEKLNPQAKIYVCGCASQNNPQQFLGKKQVECVIGTSGKGKIEENFTKKGALVTEIPKEYEDDLMATNVRTRGYIKVQDGCNNFCSYCLIPYVRGRSRSRVLSSILKEAKILSKTCKEIVITGINVSDFKINNQLALPKLFLALYEIPSRFRLSSLEVNVITPELLEVLKNMPNFCPSFHLSLQSGSDKVLCDMNRHYTTKQFLEKVDLIRKYFDNPLITTDLIVGYPTETDENFEETLKFLEQVQFASIHYFAYSSRKGTRASLLPTLNGNIIKEREEKVKNLVNKMKEKYLNSLIGQSLEVLVEEKKGKYFVGFSKNYVKCFIETPCNLGEIVNVKAVESNENGLICVV